MNTANNAGNRKLRVLTTATLIRRFHDRCLPDEIYDKAVRSYETLLDVIQKPDTAIEISTLLDMPAATIKDDAENIINILLFNKENDPYLSFGLKRYAPLSEVNRRWKSLIVLYHPDRYFNQTIIEEKAKKINKIYEEIQKMQARKIYSSSFKKISEISLPQNNKISHVTYLKYIPWIIIALAIIIAIFSILLLIFDLRFANPYTSSQEAKGKAFKLIQIDPKNVKNIHSY